MLQVPESDRPRERLLAMGTDALSDRDLLAVLLGTGTAGGDSVAELADRLLAESGGLDSLSRASPLALARYAGIGPAKATRIAAAFALAHRAAADPRPLLTSSSAIAAAARPWLATRSRERVIVLSCDARLRLLGVDVISEGAADSAPFPIREILSAVLRRDAVAFAVAHNHPSGDPNPSDADQTATDSVSEASAAAGIRCIDHVVLGGSAWRSITAQPPRS